VGDGVLRGKGLSAFSFLLSQGFIVALEETPVCGIQIFLGLLMSGCMEKGLHSMMCISARVSSPGSRRTESSPPNLSFSSVMNL
jgi:hypothetical protein